MITVQVEKFTRNIHVAEDPILEYQLNCLLLLVGHQVGWENRRENQILPSNPLLGMLHNGDKRENNFRQTILWQNLWKLNVLSRPVYINIKHITAEEQERFLIKTFLLISIHFPERFMPWLGIKTWRYLHGRLNQILFTPAKLKTLLPYIYIYGLLAEKILTFLS